VFCAETTIFIIAGILVGTKVFAVANSNIGMDDFYKLLILYVCMILARFISISLFMGVLPNLGYGLTWK
jgi:NhaP-type Na+/H+ or K+/H+ antiporter